MAGDRYTLADTDRAGLPRPARRPAPRPAKVKPKPPREGLSAARILQLATGRTFTVSWRYRDDRLRRKCRALVKEGMLRRVRGAPGADYFTVPAKVVTHRCISERLADGEFSGGRQVRCGARRYSDGSVDRFCGEPCSWIMGKGGSSQPEWPTLPGDQRCDPTVPDLGYAEALRRKREGS